MCKEKINIRPAMDEHSLWIELSINGVVTELSSEKAKHLGVALMDVAQDLEKIDLHREI